MDKKDLLEWNQYLANCKRIREATATAALSSETPAERRARMAMLTQNFPAFCKYYLGAFMDSDFGWFHLKAIKDVLQNPNGIFVWEWAREHAKSIFADVMVPMFLYARGELTGMLIASANQDKANGLLADIQAQFEANEIWISDYGKLAALGSWQAGNFATTDGIGFWAFGRGQSPRGTREGAKRPNYGVCDDLDDKALVKNEIRVRETRDWVLEDLYGALALQNSRLAVVGNRIHRRSTLAHLVGDLDPKDPKRPGIHHIKVYALENPRTHALDYNGTPAWKQRYQAEHFLNRREPMGLRSWKREYFHQHEDEGLVFRHEWIQWATPPPLREMDAIVQYTDPSRGSKTSNDYKAIVILGRKGHHIYVLRAWLRQASVLAMVRTWFDQYEEFSPKAALRCWVEDVTSQEFIYKEQLRQEETQRGYNLPIRRDTRSKSNKFDRIENISPHFERGLVFFNEAERQNPDMQTLISQFLAFPDGHDDGPDAVEGAIRQLRHHTKPPWETIRAGQYTQNNRRR